MKSDSFVKVLLIIIATLLALNIMMPMLSNPPASYAAKIVEYKLIKKPSLDAQQMEIFFNELGKEGWEFLPSTLTQVYVFKR